MSTTQKINWHTGPIPDATHIIDDGGMLYYCSASSLDNDAVANAFRIGYEGKLGRFDVTDTRSGETTEY